MIYTEKVIRGHIQTAQSCPLCGMLHPLFVKGLVYTDPSNPSQHIAVQDRGYSFCNCKNIFFTDWKNIDQKFYDFDYSAKYNNNLLSEKIVRYAQRYLPYFKDTKSKVFTEVGAANNIILDEALKQGWETCGLDINPHSKIKEVHKFVGGDIESPLVMGRVPMSDTIWASHVFEHFHDPLKVASDLFYKLNEGGYLFVAMPDPWFIPWDQPHQWLHFVMREHHILWDMDSFIDEMIRIGFKLVYSHRNSQDYFCWGDYHIVLRKP